ncbi:hypothetical protein NECAME_13906, partial [Necator americanus]
TVFQESKNIISSCKEGTAQLVIKNAEISHSGVYNLKITSGDGTAEADITLVVKTVPAAPEGPLTVKIEGNICNLSWKEPLTNGNTPILGYYIEKFDEKKKKWNFVARCTETYFKTATLTLTLRCLDIDEAATRYRFRIAAENTVGVGPTIEADGEIPKNLQVSGPPNPPGKPSVDKQNVDSLQLSWFFAFPIQFLFRVVVYSKFFLEKKSKTWKKAEICKEPSVTLFNLVSGEAFVFRVRAENSNGLSEPSEESEPILMEELKPGEKPEEVVVDGDKATAAVNYETLDAEVDPSDRKAIDANRLPNDFEAKYTICEELGQGAYGTVYRVIEKATGKTWAAKMVQVRPGVKREDVLHEISMMNQLQHDKLLHLHEAFDIGSEICLIEEFVSGGELLDKIVEDEMLMSEKEVRDYMKQILEGLAYMHSRQIVHLDLKVKTNKQTNICDMTHVTAEEPEKVSAAPSFNPTLKDCSVLLGEALKLSVGATPDVKVEWWHNGTRISESDEHYIQKQGKDGVELIIHNSSTCDQGEWKVIGGNDMGKCECSCIVDVTIPDGFMGPTFEKPLEDIRCEEQELLTLPVKIAANPAPEIIWYYNGTEIKHSDRYRILFEDEKREYSLIIVSAYAEDSGEYRCWAKNVVGEAQSVCSVRIEELEDKRSKKVDESKAPKFTMPLPNPREVSEGSEIVLSCVVTGTPYPKVTWLKDGLRYTYFMNFSMKFHFFILISFSFFYASHLSGDATPSISRSPSRSTSESIGYVSDDSRAPIITRPLVDTIVQAGCREILELEVDGTPTPMIEWYHNGKLVSESRNVRSYFDGRVAFLKFYDAQANNQGQYTCKVSNKLGVVESRADLVVQQQTSDKLQQIPIFVKKLQDITIQEVGESISLTCQARGDPVPEFRWLRDGQPVDSQASFRCRSFDDGIATLEISNVTEELCGTYTAVAYSPIGEAHSSAFVTLDRSEVKDADTTAPSIIVAPQPKITVDESSLLTIVCDIHGAPEMDISWLKNGVMLKTTERIQMERDGLACTLIISNVTPEDEGEYTIIAKDSFGEAKADTTVTVTPKREPAGATSVKIVKEPPGPVEELHVVNIDTNSVSLEWAAPSNTGGSRVDEYIVEQRTPDQQSWVEVSTVTRPRCTIKGLQPCTEYIYRVAAKNAQGVGDRSAILHVNTLTEGSKPQFTEPPPSLVTVLDGEQLNISAKFTGAPTPAVKWYRDRREITDLDSITVDSDSTSLTIHEARHGVDDSLYSCLIENDMGQVSTDISVSIILSSEDATDMDTRSELSERPAAAGAAGGAPSLLKPLTDTTVQSGQQFSLTCRITSKNGTVAWYHNDNRVKSAGRYELFTSQNGVHKLVCHTSTNDDSGVYRCVVTNNKGITQTECEVIVKDAAEQVTPSFQPPLADTTTLVGKDLVLKCRAVGFPDPELAWTKDGERLATSRRVRLVFDDNCGSELHIRDCCAQDAGIYFCTAMNTAGIQSTQCTLTVVDVAGDDAHLVVAEEEKVAKPRFIRAPPSTMDIHEGGQFKLIAKAVGEPKPSIIWKKDGREVLRTNRLYKTYLTGDGESHLLVECVVSKTSGIFTCIAHNIHGEAESETQVIVHRGMTTAPLAEKPTFSQPLKDLGVVTGHPVTLSCKVHGVPEPELKWYYIDDAGNVTSLTEDEHGWIECRGGEVAELKADCVLRNQQGTYQCVASNEHGQSSTQCYLLIGELKDEHAGPPRFLRCLRDVWAPLGEEVVFEVEVAGYPAPDLTWYHQDKRVTEGKDVKINYISEEVCELRVSQLSLRDLGSYAVEASNVHGIVKTTCFLNVGEQRRAEPPQFQQVEAPEIAVQPKVAFRESVSVAQL